MAERGIAYCAGDESELERIVRALGERFAIEQERTLRRRLYYDTFDWRLWRRRSRLWTEPEPAGARLVWQREPPRRRLGLALAAERGGEIGFAADLPAGRLRDRLTRVLGVRRLLPVVEVRAEGRLVRILDGRQKTVVRVFAELPAARAPGATGPWTRLAPLAVVQPVKGYPGACREVTGFLGGELELAERQADELEAGSVLGGLGPAGGYTGKLSVPLDRDADADDALRAVLRELLETIERNEAGTIARLDTEFLHDFRVAVRRTRSALSQTRKVWAPELIRPFRRELSWLGGITGPMRDLDVYLLALPGYAAALPAPVRADLEPFRRLLESHGEAEQAKLASALGGSRYRRLIDSWRSFLAARPAEESRPPAARQPIVRLAHRIIGKAHRRILKRGRAIDDDTPPEALHRLRIDGKKLRYLLEFFRALYPPAALGPPIRALKQLQDNLGAYNDYGVQLRMLESCGGRLATGDAPGVAAVMALGRLAAELERREARERARFSERFAEFSRGETSEHFRALLAAGETP